jgi:putative transposase
MINSGAYIWNHVVSLNNRYYRRYKKSLPKKRMFQQIAKLRKNNDYWKSLHSQTCQEIVQRFYRSLEKFFEKKQKRRPKVKKLKKFKSFVLKQSGYKVEGNKIIINKIGMFKFHKSREYGVVRRVSIMRNRVGDYFIIICNEIKNSNTIVKKLSNDTFCVGMDFGLKTFLTLSDGTSIESPQFYKQNKLEISKKHKKFSKTKKSSNNRKRKAKDLARCYRRLTNLRTDHQYKLAHQLCMKYDEIYIEDLNLAGMKKLWGRKISDLCFGAFVNKLQYVATKYGTVVHKIGRFEPSSKVCNVCEYKNVDLTLKDRNWLCPSCGTVHDRDDNASKNILRWGITSYHSVCKTTRNTVA